MVRSLQETTSSVLAGESMESAPRPITWWRLGPQDLPIFNKRQMMTVTILREGGEGTVDVYHPRRILLPLVDILFPPYDFLLERMTELVPHDTTAWREGGLTPLAIQGKLYGVLRPHATGESYGICFSPEDLTPGFQDEFRNPGHIYEMPPPECHRYGLPLWVDPGSLYNGPRPTRFEREPVI